MLKLETKKTNCEPPSRTLSQHLRWKGRQIVITNVCNLNCGGCVQLIGHFPKEKLWFMPVDELSSAILLLKKHSEGKVSEHPISIFGGEPTLHPQWDEIIALLKSHAPTIFWINTNGRLGHQRYSKEDNLVYWVDLHPESQKFVRTLYAASDAIELSDDMAYWEKAQKDCPIWKGCATSIYRDKAYFCENAGAMDWLFYDGQHGWSLNDNHPFKRTKEEIDEQARHFCKRCGWCVMDLVPRQFSKDPSHISPSNYVDIKKGRYSLEVIQPNSQSSWNQVSLTVLDETSSIGIYRLSCSKQSPKLREKILQNETSWTGIKVHEVDTSNRQEALNDGRSKYDWTIVLGPNEIIPNNALIALMNWMAIEKTSPTPRLHVSLPIYEMAIDDFDSNMPEPTCVAKAVLIGFHRDSREVYDGGIFGRLGHRKETEGSGRTSLWHDKLTDIVGGVVALIIKEDE